MLDGGLLYKLVLLKISYAAVSLPTEGHRYKTAHSGKSSNPSVFSVFITFMRQFSTSLETESMPYIYLRCMIIRT